MRLSLIFLMVISSYGVLGVAVLNRKFEELMPAGIFLSILITYCFGLAGQLLLGVYCVLSLALLAYVVSAAAIVRSKSLKKFLRLLFTPGFAMTMVLFALLVYANLGKLAYSWDEFTHWADVVKAMVSLDDLATNPASFSAFKSYVPAMPLLQYTMQVLGRMMLPGYVFFEGGLYICSQFAVYCLLIYFAKYLTWRQIPAVLLYCAVVFLVPSIFFLRFFDTVNIDSFLGVLAGFSLAYALMLPDAPSPLELAIFYLSLACLVLTKEAGMAMAAFAGAIFVLRRGFVTNARRAWRGIAGHGICTLLAIGVPKALWGRHLAASNVEVSFSNKVQLLDFLKVIRGRDPADYRFLTVKNFWSLFTELKGYDHYGVGISYMIIISGAVAAVLVLLQMLKRRTGAKHVIAAQAGVVLLVFAYFAGMLLMYMFKFSEYEALTLAGFQRYFGILLLMLAVVACVLMLRLYLISNKKKALGVAAVSMFLVIAATSIGPAKQFLTRAYVRESVDVRTAYTEVANRVGQAVPDKHAKIYIILQENMGFDYWVLRYLLRPMQTNLSFTWSIGKPFYDGDIWTISMTLEEWQQQVESSYDYVLLHTINNYFIEEFGAFFEDPATIREKTLYKLDRQTHKLQPTVDTRAA